MAMRAKKKRQRSLKMIKNDRKNLLRNAEGYIRKMRRVSEAIEARGVKSLSRQDIQELIHVSRKCSETLKKYLIIDDEMIKSVNHDFAQNLKYTSLSDSERKWLESIDQGAVQFIDDFSDPDIELKSTKEIIKKIIEFRENCDLLIADEPITPDALEKVKLFGNDVRKIAIGTGIICSDGIIYYISRSQFSSNSFFVGGQFVFNGINNLLGRE